MSREAGGSGRAPPWARPFLAAFIVATRRYHALRRLPCDEFRLLARACDYFLVLAVGPCLMGALLLLPGTTGLIALTLSSVWGIAITWLIGRPIALERRRRRTMKRP